MAFTQIIVLRKQIYQESSLIISGLSPDLGKADLISYGGAGIGGKKFPAADLFRELEVEYDERKKGALFTAKKLELVADYSPLADDLRKFKFAGKIGSFVLKNSSPELPMPYTYDTLSHILAELAKANGAWTLEEMAVLLKLTLLYENGLLPEFSDSAGNDFMENLIAAGMEGDRLPEAGSDYWRNLLKWLNLVLEYHQMPTE